MVALLLVFCYIGLLLGTAKQIGAPNDGFLLNTLTTLFRPTYTFRSLEVKRKQHLYLFGHPRNLRSRGTSSL